MATGETKYYDPLQKRLVSIPTRILTPLKPKIIRISIGKNLTTLKMAPEWFKHDDYDEALRNIIYPEGITENRPFDTVARYRAAVNKPNSNFLQRSLNTSENNTETLIVALDDFVQQLGGELSFTNENVAFDEVANRTACGIANLSSAHLLATNYIPTAKFSFLVDLDYQTQLARSGETMQDFILSFSNAIANVLKCSNDYVRVTSITKSGRTRRQSKVNFGVSMPSPEVTEQLAEDLKAQALIGFPKHQLLKHVQPQEYECKWIPLINFFQLRPSDFVPEHNIYYQSGMPTVDRRGRLPYYLPIGWHRHALRVIDKFPDDKLWLGSSNVEGEWAVAFHGTHGGAVKGITEKGLLITKIDAMRTDAVEQKGTYFDKPGLYVATHCDGGAHPRYTLPFNVPSSQNKTETFRVVFQCRVKPGIYTTHTFPVDTGQAWRFVDPGDIRPYGILVKREKTSH